MQTAPADYTFDEASGLYYEPAFGFYYDTATKLHYDGHRQCYLTWDPGTRHFAAVDPPSTSTSTSTSTTSTSTSSQGGREAEEAQPHEAEGEHQQMMWQRLQDSGTGAEYYFNPATGESQWEAPSGCVCLAVVGRIHSCF